MDGQELFEKGADDDCKSLISSSETDTEDSLEGEEKREKIYFNLCYTNFPKTQPPLTSKLAHIKNELLTTEANYVENTLNMLKAKFIRPLTNVLSEQDAQTIFYGIKELSEVHTGFHSDLSRALSPQLGPNGLPSDTPRPLRFAGEVFLRWKEKFIIYGNYCSNLNTARNLVMQLRASNEQISQEIKKCTESAELGVFQLEDVLMVPMQRITKYPLLLRELHKELLKGTSECTSEDCQQIEKAENAMAEVLEFSNKVIEDSETLSSIKQIEGSIDNLSLPHKMELKDYGRPHRKRGELKIGGLDEHDNRMRARWVFLFDNLILICRSTGKIDHLFGRDRFSHTASLFLHEYRLEDISETAPATTFSWKLVHVLKASTMHTMCAATKQEKIEWMAAIREALNTIQPGDSKRSGHYWTMHTFQIGSSCSHCRKLLHGMFFQGYRCSRCEFGVHRDCMSKVSLCKAFGTLSPSTPSSSLNGDRQSVSSPTLNSLNDLRRSKTMGFSKRPKSNPLPNKLPQLFSEMNLSVAQSPTNLNECMWYAGEMSRETAETALISKPSGTFLVRMRTDKGGANIVRSYALSFKLNRTVNHARIKSSADESQFALSESRQFPCLIELIDWYRANSLSECFPGMNARLQRPYRRSTDSQDENLELL